MYASYLLRKVGEVHLSSASVLLARRARRHAVLRGGICVVPWWGDYGSRRGGQVMGWGMAMCRSRLVVICC